MIKPYTAVGLIPTVRGIRKRKDIEINLEHLSHLVKAAAWLSSLSLPVRLIAIPEGALQGFNDEVMDLDHVKFAREGAIDIPGEETEYLGKLAKEYDTFIMGQAKARHPDLKDRFFNVGFIIDPKGEVILQHYKVSPLFPVEHSVCPHDVYDWWVAKYGRNLQAFWPVADTEIGRLGIMMANEGSYPENARALAMNGAEVVYRASYPHPATGNEYFEIQSRARALDNNMYIVAPNMGTYYLTADEATPIDTFGGRSFIINYRGQIVGRQDYGAGSTYVGGVIDIEAMRDHRARAQWDNWLKDLRTELYQIVYEKPIYPKNLYLDRVPMKHAEYREKVIKKQIELMHKRGIWKKPAR
jgi:predicted amidohydrolase